MNPIIYLYGLKLPTYGIMIATGVVTANILALWLIKKYHLNKFVFWILELAAFLGGFLGSKGLYLFVARARIDWHRFWEPDYFAALMTEGFVFYGGLIGGLLAVWGMGRLLGIRPEKYVKTLIPLLPLAHGFGRIGCFMAGCCYGKNGFPVQLLEAGFLFVLAGVLLYLKLRKNFPFMTEVYLLLYAMLRFGLEFLRADAERGHFWIFSTSQWISLGVVVYVSCVWVYRRLYSLGEIPYSFLKARKKLE